MNEQVAATGRLTRQSGTEARVAHIVEPVIADLGFELVRVRITGQNGMTVQIMAERPDGTMSVEDCEAVSRGISPELDVEDPVGRAYHLEVSSPGIDRPLTRTKDFEQWTGHEAKIELDVARDGQKRFRGTLIGLREGSAGLRTIERKSDEQRDVWLPLSDIADAKLVMTDALIEATRHVHDSHDNSSGDRDVPADQSGTED